MPQQIVTFANSIDSNIIEEFISEYKEAHVEIESLLLALENNPTDSELLNTLFRQVHSIKGNSHLLGLHTIADFIHALETVLDKVRNKKLNFDKLLGDVILEAVDHIGYLCNHARNQEAIDMDLTNVIQDELTSLSSTSSHEISGKLRNILSLLGKEPSILIETENVLAHYPQNVNLASPHLEDIRFFAGISKSAEQRSPFWHDRSQRILNIVLALNNEAGNKINEAQLEVAVYLHDFGMAFLPLEILHKSDDLTEQDVQAIRLHPNMGAALLNDNPYWLTATEIVLQHHEREDGTGYPHGLHGNEICDGAKIMAIADAFESMTNRRCNRSASHPISYTISEINNNAGTQFSPYWVSIFNKVIRNKARKS